MKVLRLQEMFILDKIGQVVSCLLSAHLQQLHYDILITGSLCTL